LKGTAAALINVPRNEVVFLNASIELQCSTNSDEPISWSFIPADGHIVTDWLLIHGNFTAYSVGKYKIDRSIRGQYNLVIDSVDFSYAGRYRCTEGSFGTESEAELVVIGKDAIDFFFCDFFKSVTYLLCRILQISKYNLKMYT